MTLTQNLYLDQQRCNQQQDIAVDLYMSGITDGYHNNPKQNAETEYLQGYIEGLCQYNRELQDEIEQILVICPKARKDKDEDCPF